jgi:outer membrane protein assembly factor BamB
MGQSCNADTASPGSATPHVSRAVRFFIVVLAVALAACGSAVPSNSPGGSPVPQLSPTAVATQPGPPATADDWPFFRGDAARTGEGGSGPKGKPVQLWKYQANGSINGAVVIAGDLVYASSDDNVLHALDIDTGKERWHFNPVNPPVSEPAYADGVIYAFDGAGTLFALDAKSGDVRWHAPKPIDFSSSLTIGDGLIYVGMGSGSFVALDVATGAERWRYAFAGTAGAVHDPAWADGIVYAGSDSGGFVAVDGMTGAPLWQFKTGLSSATAVVAEGIAYIGDHSETGDTGHRYALAARTGQPLWQLDTPHGSPAVWNQMAYSGSGSGLVTAYDTASGHELWHFQMQGTSRVGAVADGVLYVTADDHRFYALAAASGKELWHFDVDGGIRCCVAVAHSSVFVGTDSGSVYDIVGDGSLAASPGPVKFLWSAVGGGDGMSFPGDVAIDPQGHVWVADTGNSRFAIFDPDGKFVEYWEHRGTGVGEFILERSNGDGYGAIAFAPDGSFYVLDVGNRRVEHFDKQRVFMSAWGGFGTGPGLYEDPIGLAVDSLGVVYVLDDTRNVVESYDAKGHVIATLDAHPGGTGGYNSANSLSIDALGNFYISDCCSAGNQVQKLDSSGALLATIGATRPGQFTDQPGSMAIDGRGRLFVAEGPTGTGDKILIFGADGTFLASFGPPGSGDGQFRFATGLALDGNGNIFVGDASSNRIQEFHLLPPFAP